MIFPPPQLRLGSIFRRRACAVPLALLLASAGCSLPQKYHLTDRSCVSDNLIARFDQPLGPTTCSRQIIYPNGISLQVELNEEQAVILALWNNALLLETLADVGIAQGDLVQAGLLPNPEFVYFWPVHDKPFKYLTDFPLESLWLRPIRVAAGEREVERQCQRVTQVGLDTIRDTRQAFADVLLAHGQKVVAYQAVEIRKEIARLAQEGLAAGDISRQEASASLIEAHIAEQDAARIDFNIAIAEERLRNLMGVSDDRAPLRLSLVPMVFPEPPPVGPLVSEAIASRPDALAAVRNAEAFAERLRITRIGWVRFLGILDATSGRNGHEFGPAMRMTVPIFNWNQGNIARSEADLEKAERQRKTVNNQIVQDVYQAHLRYEQGRAEIKILDERVLPEVDAAIRRTELAYKEGATSYVVVLQNVQQFLTSRLRQYQLQTELRRNWAELERSVGRHLADFPRPAYEHVPVPNTPREQMHEAARVQTLQR
jgi:cobalt-zinc-cadmium efflux system outer membrane protein